TPDKFSEIARPQIEKANTPQSQIKEITPKAHIKQVTELPQGEEWEFWYQARKFIADIVFEKKHFEYEIPELGAFLAVRSGLGTGKTYYLINKLLKAYEDLGAISIGHRNSLLIQFCEEAKGWYHLQEDIKDTQYERLIGEQLSKIACCVDSLVHFRPEDFDGKLLIIDETESVIAHLLLSDTSVGTYREKAKQRFTEALDRAALVICLDGHLTDATIKYLQSLMKNPKKLVKVQNTYQGNRGKVDFYLGAKAGDKFKTRHYNDFVNKAINNPNKFVFAADSQQKLESLERMLRDRGRITFRFDSTTPYEEKKKFLQNPVAYLIENRIEILLYSPSGDAGLNIDIQGYFTDLYFLFMGVLTTSPQLQMLGRIRDPEAVIHIYCTPEGLPGKVIGKEVIPEKIQAFQLEYVLECAKATLSGASIDDIVLELAQDLIAAYSEVNLQQECFLIGLEQHERKNLRQCLRLALEESGYSVEEKWTNANSDCEELKIKRQEIINEYSEKMFALPRLSPEEVEKKSRESNITLDEKLSVTKTRLLTRLPNIEDAIYRQPTQVNHIDNTTSNESVVNPETPIQNEQNNQLDSQAITPVDAAPNQDNVSIVNSEPVETDEYVEKAIFSPEFIKKVKFENPQYISQLEMYWLVTHPEIAKRLQQGKWYKKLTVFTDPKEPEYAKKLDISGWKSQWLKIHKLLEMGFGYFLAPGAEWSNESQEAKVFYNSAKNPKTERLTGIKVGESAPCELIGRVVRSLGHKTESQQIGKGKDKVRVYRISQACLDDPMRQAILNSIEKRYADLLAEKEVLNWDSLTEAAKELKKSASQNAEMLISEDLEVEHLPSRCSIKNQMEGVLSSSQNEIGSVSSATLWNCDIGAEFEKIELEMGRLRWTAETGHEYLFNQYQTYLPVFLSKTQLLEFIAYLEAQPTPLDATDEKKLEKSASQSAETQSTQLFQENTFPQGVLIKPEERCSADADFCLSTLAALESPDYSSITSSEQVIALFSEMETRGERCNDELPEGFWERVSVAVGLLFAQFENPSQPSDSVSEPDTVDVPDTNKKQGILQTVVNFINFKVGDFVTWSGAPDWFKQEKINRIEDNHAWVNYWASPIPIDKLILCHSLS
ncbi:MAG TPA: plasmid replication protein, CyRepA1 family, partial [Phormidium sp.]